MKNQFIELAENYGDNLIEQYTINHLSLKELGKRYNVQYYIVGRALKHLGITLRTTKEVSAITSETNENLGRTYSLDKHYFKQWNSDMAYILGFIASDGNVFKKEYITNGRVKEKNTLTIALNSIDESHVNLIKEKLGYSGKTFERTITSTYKNIGNVHKSVGITITSKDMVNDLINLGIVNNKSLVVKFPDVPKEYELDFIRGYFDGDGSVGFNYPTNKYGIRTNKAQIRVRFCSGSYDLIYEIQNKLTSYGLKSKTISSAKNKTLYEIAYSTKESELIYTLFYSKEGCMKLNRKYESFTNAIKTRNEDLTK